MSDDLVSVELSPPLGDGLKGAYCGGADCMNRATHLIEVLGESEDGTPMYYPTCLDCYARMLKLAKVIE